MFEPIWNPEAIERKSFEIIEQTVPADVKASFGRKEWPVVRRMIHTTGDLDYGRRARFSRNGVEAGISAIKAGLPVVTDTKMALAGISVRRIARFGSTPYCFMGDPDTALLAKEMSTTRAAAAVHVASKRLGKIGIFAIGNAPTALLALLDMVSKGKMEPPVLVVGTPVGFVSALESKEFLMESPLEFISVEGNKGGSAVAATVVNALAIMAEEEGNWP